MGDYPNATAEGRGYAKRWLLLEERELEEKRHASVELRVRQLSVLMGTARVLGWEERLREGEQEVRDRWRLIPEKSLG